MTVRNALFQVHWFLGISAGLVLALVGVTGGILSFEDALLEAMNPGVMTVEPAGRPKLSPDSLVERIRKQRPDDRLQSLTLSRDPGKAARVGFAPPEGGQRGPGGRGPRGESRYVDPYSGDLLDQPRGEGFFRTTMRLHRWLAIDDVGKQVVGFSTIVLVYFCLSGLYLRWPRRWGSLRTWLALDWKQKGRNFLWHLHSVLGTWVLLAYLVMALTGLWWSYGWYRDAVNAWAGRQELPEVVQDASRGTPPRFDPAAAWRAFEGAVPGWGEATMNWPKDDEPVSFRYLDLEPAHERARNELRLDRWTLAPDGHLRYDHGDWKQKIGASMFALHRGSFFGTAGVVLFMLASLLMPLFAVTGWMLYLERRTRQRDARRLAAQAALPAIAGDDAPLLVAFASQTGNAQRLAWQTAGTLAEAGVPVEVKPLGQLAVDGLARSGRVLFVVSTFGESQPPDSARAIARRLRALPTGAFADLHYAILSLGDSEYGEDFCGFGRELDQWLQHAGAQALFDRVDVDAQDPGAIRHWQHHVGLLAGRTDLPDWTPPRYQRWTLADRRHLNPGSAGGAVFHLSLVPSEGAGADWQAGDIAEVGPRNAPAKVDALLSALALDGASRVRFDGGEAALAEALSRAQLPEAADASGYDAATLASILKPLPHREYSISSLPADGRVEFLLRRMLLPDGTPGLASGWLCHHAGIGDAIDLRVRANPGFHAPDPSRPMVLVGNGTGIGGLRAHVKARVAAGARRNWLLFGERNFATDRFHGGELDAWRRDGYLEHLDLAFSRDGGESGGPRMDAAAPAWNFHHGYVQDALRVHASRLREWLKAGAVVYVCGSLEGMAPGVDAVLREVVGTDTLEAMAADGRYRRDVY